MQGCYGTVKQPESTYLGRGNCGRSLRQVYCRFGIIREGYEEAYNPSDIRVVSQGCCAKWRSGGGSDTTHARLSSM